ncbi:hypothetical protein SAMD00019534_119570 [Acytostelium subglobosum LB1]|uniref:hypothetical protein n=1 Tax=Acytostelium subglobosum LB1 TaxID=1410327 RepID=UPI000644BEC0|nr:hypothetical protein SAMD00019534_119570 [Acytostelium subglobosum LB1]GAM28781.1 hypothetical protein SAMD00019534_119570 [Acytostelium subglobosum LB1]|eukprot:XP_012748336.1 hypothetical protein SAMD00019534_119570 [Acytostelium subglobosum LB1]
MDEFDRIEQNYNHVCSTINRRIKQLPNFTGERKKVAIREAEQDINEAIQYINDMERNSQTHPQRVKVQQKIKQYQTDVQRFKREVQQASTTSTNDNYNNNGIINGFSNAPEDYQSQYENQRQHLLGGYETVNQSGDRLMRAHQVSAENEIIGESILMDMSRQGQQLRGMKGKLEETDDNIKTARKVISSMARRVVTNKVILTFIILLLLGIIILIVCLKWLR